MGNKEDKNNKYSVVINRLIVLIIFLLILLVTITSVFICYLPKYIPKEKVNYIPPTKTETIPSDTIEYWTAPELSSLENNADKELILYGKELIVHTSKYFGNIGSINKSATNGMNCQNCHLDAGTKIFGNNYSAVASTYPKYRARSGSIETIHKRVNDCFERSLNGKALDTSSKEMKAIIAYIKWLGSDVKKGEKPTGSGLKEITFLKRPADPVLGKVVYEQKCKSCHRLNGEGLLNAEKTEYTYPPVWGTNSFNSGAGLFRLSNFAKFVRNNMPLNGEQTGNQLTDEEAWDVAAYVNSQSRPGMNIKLDWPIIQEKPFDHPFGPYADGFTVLQHKFGPFEPIKEKISFMQKTKSH